MKEADITSPTALRTTSATTPTPPTSPTRPSGVPAPATPVVQVDEAALVTLLGSWTTRASMLSAALADRLADLMHEGALPPGTVLPSQPRLSRALGISRITVRNAFEMLHAAGLLDLTTRTCHRRR